jgi:hypothetical protein
MNPREAVNTMSRTAATLAFLACLGTAACTAGGHAKTVHCGAGLTDCDNDGTCETDITLPSSCGRCKRACVAGPHSQPTCTVGRCGISCDPGWADCDGDSGNGCESDLTAPGSCGSCANSCGGACVAGACATCDNGLTLDSNEPMDAARALGLCDGLVSARWMLPDGTDPSTAPGYQSGTFSIGHGILSAFGAKITPHEGVKLVALSSGSARQPTDPGFHDPVGFDKRYTARHPIGFPRESPACPGVITGPAHDSIALELTLKVPDWAKGFAFDFDFYTFEWPSYVCSHFNDVFVALLSPFPKGQSDGNITFDPMGNPITVNSAFVSVCGCAGGPPCIVGGKQFSCTAGTSELVGTGFQEPGVGNAPPTHHAATGWLTTTAPVEPGATITLRLGIYDSGDGGLDSTALLDKFRWLPSSPVVNTAPVP